MSGRFGTYSISIDVSSVYFISPDNRVKYFPAGIDLISKGDSTAEPIGVACVECIETGSFLLSVFRVRSGLDLSKLIVIAKSPGVMDLMPCKLIFGKHLIRSLSVSDKNNIKQAAMVDSIGFSSIESDLAKSLPGYSFDSISNLPRDIDNLNSFISYVNEQEYELSIKRKLVKSVSRDTSSLIKDLSLANAVRLHHQRNDWRPAPDAQQPLEGKVCAISERVGILDICSVVDRPTNPFGRNGFDPFTRSPFEDWMHDEEEEDDDDDDDDDECYDEHGNRLNLSYEDNIYLISAFHMLICDNELWEDPQIDLDHIGYIEECEDDLPAHMYHGLKRIITGNCIFHDIDCWNFVWPVNEISEKVEIYDFIELVTPRRSKNRNHFFVTIFDRGVHISIMNPLRYNSNEIEENLDILGIECSEVRVQTSVIDSIQCMVELVDSPETMIAAVTMIKRLLSNRSEYFEDYFSCF
ncbi:hypothetical protein V0M98_36755 (plasmid) [Pseudomonas silesiensis]|uniref:hypothetical protein n=1 Tax=Pseudomonas silesiensis TaxID=1853130 RepID=UPI0030CC0615